MAERHLPWDQGGATPTPPEGGTLLSEGDIVIEGSETIPSSQNFFQQEPFQTLIDDIKNKGVAKGLRGYLQEFARAVEKIGGLPPQGQEARGRVLQQCHYEAYLNSKGSPHRDLHNLGYKAIKVLDRYPFWTEYVSNYLTVERYTKDGEPSLRQPQELYAPIPSYGSWLAVKLIRTNTRLLYGIKDIFVQDLAGASVQQAIQANTGIQPGRVQRWIVRHAAEIPPKYAPRP